MNKSLIVLSALTLSFFVCAQSTVAQYNQYQTPTQTLSILVDKMVGKPIPQAKGGESVEYVDNLTQNNYKFKPGENVTFQLKVKNTSNTNLINVKVVDTLPEYVVYVSGGSFDSTANSVTISAGDFRIDEEKYYNITVRVVPQENLPANRGVVCVTNKVKVENEKVSDDDTAQFCIEKQVIGVVEQVPTAGPEQAIAITVFSSLAALVGLKLRRYAA